ncbi:DUF2007 domain-containing protein [Maricaulis salignorans]|uniref:putative signal transducing protein n=1 Tax=Maricaulis salignorans TaxID=144026 RepID=UPI003A92C9D7
MVNPTTPLLVHSHGHAVIVVNALQAAGIPAVIADNHMQDLYPGMDHGFLRPRILVPPACEAEARAIIAQAQVTDEAPLYPCPHCGGETQVRTRPVMAAVLLTLTGQFSKLRNQPRFCRDCDSYDDVADPEPFTAEELGYPPIR